MYFLNQSKIQTFDDLRFYQVCQSPTMFYSCFEKNLFHPIKNIQMLTEVEGNIDYIDYISSEEQNIARSGEHHNHSNGG